jgi:hypothetical protein
VFLKDHATIDKLPKRFDSCRDFSFTLPRKIQRHRLRGRDLTRETSGQERVGGLVMRPGLALVEARGTTRIPCVASLTDGRTTVITTRPFRGRLCCSIAMRTGNGSYG